eukprot:scaffold1697_cov180-Amphora_coffeaeformis.AAC.2
MMKLCILISCWIVSFFGVAVAVDVPEKLPGKLLWFGRNHHGLRRRALEATTPTVVNHTSLVLEDTFVRENNPNKNYDHVTNLGVAYGPTSSNRTTYAKFPIDAEVRERAESIESAVVFFRLNSGPSLSMDVNVWPCETENWVEELITWNFRPGLNTSLDALIANFTLVSDDVGTWVAIDLTDEFVDAYNDPTRYSISIVLEADIPDDNDPDSQLGKFDSKEDGTNIPYIQVTYVEAPIPPTVSPAPSETGSMAPTKIPSLSPSSAPTVDWDQPDYPQLVSVAPDGSLQYVPYANEINLSRGSIANFSAVNTVPDFSNCGYKGGGVSIPFVPVEQTLEPSNVTGVDRRQDIQAAIDAVAALPLVNGFRGAVLLKAGLYEVSNPGIYVHDSGIVLRGEGQGASGTTILYTSTIADDAITLGFTNGGYDNTELNDNVYDIVDPFVPVGSKTITITDASTLSPGDEIIIKLQPNSDWLLHSTCI